MRLFTLAVVAGIGVLIGVAIYVGQAVINPPAPNKKIASVVEIGGDGEARPAEDANVSVEPERPTTVAGTPVDTTTSESVEDMRNQLPAAFKSPAQNSVEPQSTPAAELQRQPLAATDSTAPIAVPDPTQNGQPPDSQTATSTPSAATIPLAETPNRSDTPYVMPPVVLPTAAPATQVTTVTHTNRHVQYAVSAADGDSKARTRTIVSK